MSGDEAGVFEGGRHTGSTLTAFGKRRAPSLPPHPPVTYRPPTPHALAQPPTPPPAPPRPGFHKILKKHDKMLPHTPCRQFYISHLHNQPWVQVRRRAGGRNNGYCIPEVVNK